MKNYGILFVVFLATFQGLGASAPAPVQQDSSPSVKIGTLANPSQKIYHSPHRRISSIGLGTAFTNTIKKILNDKQQTQSKNAGENDALAPMKLYLQVAQENIINSSDDLGNTALHLAAFEGGKIGKSIVEYLLNKSSIAINKKNTAGFTPLVRSIQASNYEIFKLLLVRKEIMIATPDQYDRLPVDYIKDLPANDVNKTKMFKEWHALTAKRLARASVPEVDKTQLKMHSPRSSASGFDDGADVLGGEPSDSCGGCCGFLFLKTK